MDKVKRFDNQEFKFLLDYLKSNHDVLLLKDLAKKTEYNYKYLSNVKAGNVEYSKDIKGNLCRIFGIAEDEYKENIVSRIVAKVEHQPPQIELLQKEIQVR